MTRPTTTGNKHAIYSLGMWETFFWVQTSQVGIGLLSLPRVVSEEAGHSGWIAIPLATLLAQIGVWLIILLMRRFESRDVFDIFRLLFGRWIGNVAGFLFAAHCVVACGLVTRTYIELVQTWLFPTTSTLMFYLLLLVPTFYLITSNPRVIGRYCVMTFFGTIWIAMLMYRPIEQIQTDFYLPLLDTTWMKIIKATLMTSHSVTGFEVLLVFYPYIQDKKKALRWTSYGIWFTCVIYLFVTLVCFGFYSQGQLQQVQLPTVHLLQVVQLPMIERVEHLVIAVWSFLIVSTTASYLWAASAYLSRWKRFEKRTWLWLLVPMLPMGIWPEEVYVLNRLALFFGWLGGFICLILPALLLLFAMMRGIKGTPDQAPEEARQAS